MLGLLLEVLFELLLQIVVEILIELGFASVKEALGRKNQNPVLATIGYALLGGALGGISLLMWPARFIRQTIVPGTSLVIGPLLSGAAMHWWGDFRRTQGHSPTNLATFYGGAAFALGVALVRFIWAQ